MKWLRNNFEWICAEREEVGGMTLTRIWKREYEEGINMYRNWGQRANRGHLTFIYTHMKYLASPVSRISPTFIRWRSSIKWWWVAPRASSVLTGTLWVNDTQINIDKLVLQPIFRKYCCSTHTYACIIFKNANFLSLLHTCQLPLFYQTV